MDMKKPLRISPVRVVPISFFLLIMAGTFMLMLPVATAQGETTGFTTALFTSTTSVCVTGLVVVDTFAHWSLFGQIVILSLIQIGGLGVIAVGFMFMLVGKKRFTLGDRVLLNDSLNVTKNIGLIKFLIRIFQGTFFVEGIGALLFAIKFVPLYGLAKGLWFSIFQSVSAFCNAGMDVIGPDSMITFNDSPYLMGITMGLIILGGLGFVVWFDLIDGIYDGIRHRLSPRKILNHLPEHTKLVLIMTVSLILIGTFCTLAAEYNNPGTIGNMSLPGKIYNSLFQSVTYRTAGFASVPQQKLTEISCMVGYTLMFVGGSPVGTAGGIKTVTAFLFFMNAFSYANGRKENVIFKRRVTGELMRKASAIVFVSFFAVWIMTALLLTEGGISLTDGLFEIVSALGTVGLSRGLTPALSRSGRIIVIVSMFLGRMGPISMAIFFAKSAGEKNKVRHAEGMFYVG